MREKLGLYRNIARNPNCSCWSEIPDFELRVRHRHRDVLYWPDMTHVCYPEIAALCWRLSPFVKSDYMGIYRYRWIICGPVSGDKCSVLCSYTAATQHINFR